MGAAVAVSLGVGGIAVTNAAVSTGERAVFIPIAPCRLFDTRPAPSQVGPRSAPLGPGEIYTVQVTGVNGNCTIPADATGVAMNVTTVDGSGSSYLTVWPADVGQPLASNLNWVPGSPPTPNKVDVKLSATGAISLFNNVGTVAVLADVVGYYADHNHDDRYYTKTQTDAKFATTAKLTLSAAGFTSDGAAVDWTNGCARQPAGDFTVRSGVQVPVGVTITSISAFLIDSNATNGTIRLLRTTGSNSTIATATTAGTPSLHQLVATLATPEVVNAGEYFLIEYTGGDGTTAHQLCGVEVNYNIPAGQSILSTDANQGDPAGVPSGTE